MRCLNLLIWLWLLILAGPPLWGQEADGMRVVLIADGRQGGLPSTLSVNFVAQGQAGVELKPSDDGLIPGDNKGNQVGVAHLVIRKAQVAELTVKVGDQVLLTQRVPLPAESVVGLLVQRIEGDKWRAELVPGGRVGSGDDILWAGPALSEQKLAPGRAEVPTQTSPWWWVWSLGWLGVFGWLTWRAQPRTTPLPFQLWTPLSSHRRLWLREVGQRTDPLQVEICSIHPTLELCQQALIRTGVRGVPALILGEVPLITRVLDHEGAGQMKEGAPLHLGPVTTSLEDITHFVRQNLSQYDAAAILVQDPPSDLRQSLANLKPDGGVLELVWIVSPSAALEASS